VRNYPLAVGPFRTTDDARRRYRRRLDALQHKNDMRTERERAARRIGGVVIITAGARSRGNHLAASEPQRIRAMTSLEGNQPV